jgi:hypothetical protein
MSNFRKKLVVILFGLLSVFGQMVAQTQDPCVARGYEFSPSYIPGLCRLTGVLVYWNSADIHTTIKITNTTKTGRIVFQLTYRGKDGKEQPVIDQDGSNTPLGGAQTSKTISAGQPTTTISLRSLATCDINNFCVASSDPSLHMGEIQVYMDAPPDVLDQQEDSATVATTAYAPDKVTVALPFEFSRPLVRRSSLHSGAAGNILELPPQKLDALGMQVPDYTDIFNFVMLVNEGEPQKFKVALLDSNGSVVGVPFVTDTVAKNGLLLKYFSEMFGSSMFVGGKKFEGTAVYEGLGGGKTYAYPVKYSGWYRTDRQDVYSVGN